MLSDMILSNVWTRSKREHGLYRYNPSGQYFARVRFRGKLYRRKLDTDDWLTVISLPSSAPNGKPKT